MSVKNCLTVHVYTEFNMLLKNWCATKQNGWLLEESSYWFSSSHHLAEMIPIFHRQKMLQSEINVDGTTRVCEAMVIVP